MLKQELIHSHILVAIFCGWEICRPNKEFPHGYLKLEQEGEETVYVSNDNILEELPYGTDWNYFMEAWKCLIEATGEPGTEPEVHKDLEDIIRIIESAILNGFRQLAFNEMVRAIEHINKLKLQEA